MERSALATSLFGAAGLASPGHSDAADAAAAAAPAGAVPRVNARQHGAKGDGQSDDTRALQSALEAARKDGPICYVPPGLYRLAGALTVPPGVTLCGASGGVPHSEHPIGTVLLAVGGRGQADGEPLITLKPNAVARNLIIHYPEQTLAEVAPYPWSIRADGELCQIRDITLTNPYQALDLGSRWNELHLVRNVFACPLKIGVYIDQCTDIGRLENIHFNPNFWTRMALKPGFPGGNIKAYLEKNLVGFKIGKTDWEFISNSFVIFPRIGFHFDDFGHGPGNAVITQSGSDIGPDAGMPEDWPAITPDEPFDWGVWGELPDGEGVHHADPTQEPAEEASGDPMIDAQDFIGPAINMMETESGHDSAFGGRDLVSVPMGDDAITRVAAVLNTVCWCVGPDIAAQIREALPQDVAEWLE